MPHIVEVGTYLFWIENPQCERISGYYFTKEDAKKALAKIQKHQPAHLAFEDVKFVGRIGTIGDSQT